MAAELDQSVTVKIFHRTYRLRSRGDAEHIRALADYVDRHMVQISDRTPTVDTLRVAILAALSIADECLSARRRLERVEAMVCRKSEELNGLMRSVLSSEDSEQT